MKFTSVAVFLEPAYQGNGTDLARSGGSFPRIPLPPTRGKPNSWTSEAMSSRSIVVMWTLPAHSSLYFFQALDSLVYSG